MLEKVGVASLTTFWACLIDEAGYTPAQKRSKRKVSNTWRTMSMAMGVGMRHRRRGTRRPVDLSLERKVWRVKREKGVYGSMAVDWVGCAIISIAALIGEKE